MAEVRIEFDGAEEIALALNRKFDLVRAAVESAIGDEMSQTHRDMADALRVYSHPLRTPTPSPPGGPPAMVTGALIRSINEVPVRWVTTLVAEGSLGPTMVYARIQELGGRAGRNHAAHLPPRPYVAPVAAAASVRFPQTLHERVSAALRS